MCSALTLAWTVFLDPLAFRILVPQPNLCRHTRIRNVREKKSQGKMLFIYASQFCVSAFRYLSKLCCSSNLGYKKNIKYTCSNATYKMIRWLDIFLDLCGLKKSFICMQTSARPWMHPYFLAFLMQFCYVLSWFFLVFILGAIPRADKKKTRACTASGKAKEATQAQRKDICY